jgi:hypothetical protein
MLRSAVTSLLPLQVATGRYWKPDTKKAPGRMTEGKLESGGVLGGLTSIYIGRSPKFGDQV